MRPWILAIAFAVLAVVSACSDDDTSDANAADEDSPTAADVGTVAAPELDLATLQAEGSTGVYNAERVEATHVGAVTDELFLGVVFDETTAAPGQEVRAYLCNGDDVAHWVAGELDESGNATLAPQDLVLDGAPDIRVELTTEGELAGDVVIDEESTPFTLAPATDDAGVYRAEENFDADTSRASWVVLPDGRQVGGACQVVRCGRNPSTGAKVCFCVKRK